MTGAELAAVLRERIDELKRERDAALEEMWKARASQTRARQRADATRRRVSETRSSRDMWKQRALDAEAMLNQIHVARRRKKACA